MRSPLPKAGRAITVVGDTIVKVQLPEGSRRERLRTQAGREVGERTGLFVVPEILGYDDARGEIVFERLAMTGLRQALSTSGRSMDLIGRTAAALAAIHGQMAWEDRAGPVGPGRPGPPPAGRWAALHGDFGMANVFHLPASDRLAIIDWANADWTGVTGDRGAPEIDVAVFLLSLFQRRPFGPSRIDRRHRLARHFLATYASASPHGLDRENLRAVVARQSPAFTALTRRRKGTLYALACRPALIDLRFFLRRLSDPG